MRAGKVATLALLTALLPALGADLDAHRLDEYLHAARLSIDSAGVRLELSLTAGISVADTIVGEIDANGDGMFSAAERDSYAQRVVSGLSLRLDDTPVALSLAAATFPAAAALRTGDAAIVLRIEARPPHLTTGAHRVSFHNRNGAHGAVYLANALLPDDRRVAITALQHAVDQSGLTVTYTVHAAHDWRSIFRRT